jgi:hypothetical protein
MTMSIAPTCSRSRALFKVSCEGAESLPDTGFTIKRDFTHRRYHTEAGAGEEAFRHRPSSTLASTSRPSLVLSLSCAGEESSE